MFQFAVLSIVVIICFDSIDGHGRLMVPPARSSMWREGFDTPIEYTDMGNNCGGMANQWEENGGKCGICGDPYDQPRPRSLEHGGKFGTGTIARVYEVGQIIEIKVEVTAPHMGYFEFRICNMDDLEHETLECLNKNMLELIGDDKIEHEGRPTRWAAGSTPGMREIKAKLPSALQCKHCVIQWKWHTGNSYGFNENGENVLGAGPQEEFYGCSDIQIVGSGESGSVVVSTARPPSTTTTITLPPAETYCSFVGDSLTMFGKEGLEPYLNELCICSCSGDGFCPENLCQCTTKCRLYGAYGTFARNETASAWCDDVCHQGEEFCPADKCTCLVGGVGRNEVNGWVMVLVVVAVLGMWY